MFFALGPHPVGLQGLCLGITPGGLARPYGVLETQPRALHSRQTPLLPCYLPGPQRAHVISDPTKAQQHRAGAPPQSKGVPVQHSQSGQRGSLTLPGGFGRWIVGQRQLWVHLWPGSWLEGKAGHGLTLSHLPGLQPGLSLRNGGKRGFQQVLTAPAP